jgi:hypothetical protein
MTTTTGFSILEKRFENYGNLFRGQKQKAKLKELSLSESQIQEIMDTMKWIGESSEILSKRGGPNLPVAMNRGDPISGINLKDKYAQLTAKALVFAEDAKEGFPPFNLRVYNWDLTTGLQQYFPGKDEILLSTYNSTIAPIWPTLAGAIPDAGKTVVAGDMYDGTPDPANKVDPFRFLKLRFDDWLFEELMVKIQEVKDFLFIKLGDIPQIEKINALLEYFKIAFVIEFDDLKKSNGAVYETILRALIKFLDVFTGFSGEK